MPHALYRSARHAIAGLRCAWRSERNVRLFLIGYCCTLLLGIALHLTKSEWFALLFVGGLFLCTELLNTAIEHLANIVDDHLKAAHCAHTFEDLKATKDIAAAASLVSLVVVIVTIAVIFVPHVVQFEV